MSLLSNAASALFSEKSSAPSERQTEAAIDASARLPVLCLAKTGLVWTLLSLVLGAAAFAKLRDPDFLFAGDGFSYGVVMPAFWHALVYGALFNGGLAVALWIFARLSGAPCVAAPLLFLSAGLWNFGVLVGLIGLFAGDQLPYELLAFPGYAMRILFVAFLGMGIWAVFVFKRRLFRASFASQWHILAALFAFAWIYSAAYLMLVAAPVQGALQRLVNAWYLDNLLGLVIAPLALAALCYHIPKLLGIPLVGYRQAGLAFWSWILFNAFRGPAEIPFGPVPAWAVSVGVVASFGLLLPVTIYSIQFLGTLFARFSEVWESRSLRFAFFGAICFLASASAVTQFSIWEYGVQLVGLVGFAGAAFAGVFYFMIPRLLDRRLFAPVLVDVHFWSLVIALVLVGSGLLMGGLQQGRLLNESLADTVSILETISSSVLLVILGFGFLILGTLASAVAFFGAVLSPAAPKEDAEPLIAPAPEMELPRP